MKSLLVALTVLFTACAIDPAAPTEDVGASFVEQVPSALALEPAPQTVCPDVYCNTDNECITACASWYGYCNTLGGSGFHRCKLLRAPPAAPDQE